MSKNLSPVKAIRAKCLECGGSYKEVRLCAVKTCPSYPYRMGKNPNRKGIGGRPKRFFRKRVIQVDNFGV